MFWDRICPLLVHVGKYRVKQAGPAIIAVFNPLESSGLRWLHFEMFYAIQV